MKVAIVPSWYPSSNDPVGGSFFVSHARALTLEHDVRVIAPARGSSLPQFVKATLFRLFAGPRPDVIHAHVAVPAGIAALIGGRALGVPVVLTEHSGPLSRLFGTSRVRKDAVRRVLSTVDALAVPSRGLAEQLRALGVRRRVWHVPNVVPAPERAPQPGPKGHFVAVGMMDDRSKGYEILLRAWEQLPSSRARHLRIVGDGTYAGGYQALARTLGIEETVTFVGALPHRETLAEIERAEALISSSIHESFGLATVEAAALGRPVVATRVGANPTFVNRTVGYLVEPGDAPALSAAIGRYELERDRFDPLAIAQAAGARFGPSVVCRESTRLYRDALLRRGGRHEREQPCADKRDPQSVDC